MLSCRRFYVRDGALIGDLRDSLEPMIWRMELSRVHTVGFKVRHNAPVWELGMEGATGGFAPIASYSSEAAARKALAGISHSLKSAGLLRRFVNSVVMLIVLAFLLYILYVVGSSMLGIGGSQQVAATQSQLPQASMPIGQSLPADQTLRAPPPLQ